MQIINTSSSTSWLYITCGAIVGGLAIKFIGFRGSRRRRNGGHNFFRMCLWYLNGVTVTSFTTIVLKCCPLIEGFVTRYPKLTIVFIMIGSLRTLPRLLLFQSNVSLFSWEALFPWMIFWQLPSIYFAQYNFSALSNSLKSSVTLITVCFSVGTIIPLKNTFVSDLGLKVTSSGSFFFIFGFIFSFLPNQVCCEIPLTVIIDTSLIVLFSGVLIDDMQHIKYKLENEQEEDSTTVLFNPVTKSVPIFIESVLIFGRVVSLVTTLCETWELTI